MSDWEVEEPENAGGKGAIPQGRVYVHKRCGGHTQVSGGDFMLICDPLRICTGTYCCTCRGFVPLSDVRWADTAETVAEYRTRLRRETPLLVKLWRGGLGLLPGAAAGTPFGFLAALMVGVPQAGINLYMAGGAAIGALFGYAAGTHVLHRVYNIDYRRMR